MERPWYLRPPLSVLFDLDRLGRLRPWDVDVAFLLSLFLNEMEKRREVDFRASGVALDSSASIHLMKSRLLLKLEEPPREVEPVTDFVPPPLILPIRYELTTTTIQHLLSALDEALRGERLLAARPPSKPMLPPPPEAIPPITAYLLEVEKLISWLYERMLRLVGGDASKKSLMTFSKLVEGLRRIDKVRAFIALLFMAQRGIVELWQDENTENIFIILKGGLKGR